MLSAETASGRHPLAAVRTMDRVLREVEREQWRSARFAEAASMARATESRLRDSVARAAVDLVRDLRLEAVVVPTRTGTTMRIVAAHRLSAPTVGVCADAAVARRMALSWGVVPVRVEASGTRNWRRLCTLVARRCGLARSGQRVLVISGFHDAEAQSEPVLKVLPL
jgi:pyruvate kinase